MRRKIPHPMTLGQYWHKSNRNWRLRVICRRYSHESTSYKWGCVLLRETGNNEWVYILHRKTARVTGVSKQYAVKEGVNKVGPRKQKTLELYAQTQRKHSHEDETITNRRHSTPVRHPSNRADIIRWDKTSKEPWTGRITRTHEESICTLWRLFFTKDLWNV